MRLYILRPAAWLILLLTVATPSVWAQINEQVFTTDTTRPSDDLHRLSLEFDNLNFFRNVESATLAAKGYTLPGFWLQVRAAYRPAERVTVEAGLHTLWFWGANRYPAFAYNDIAVWRGESSCHHVHLLPFFRARAALSPQVDIILGDLYGGANHRLIEPLYNPELNLSADPEAGLQILYHPRHAQLDVWLNWESFIYKLDTHQEAFTFGLSSRLHITPPDAPLHLYALAQGLAQHRGGEIDTISGDQAVQTMLNGALGAGLEWHIRRGVLRQLALEYSLTGYYQHAGNLWPVKRGYGRYLDLRADLSPSFYLRAAYWQCDGFVSLFGHPYFGVISTYLDGAVYRRPQMLRFGAEYTRHFSRDCSLGIDFDAFHRLAAPITDPAGRYDFEGPRFSYSFGVYLRFRPTFPLKGSAR